MIALLLFDWVEMVFLSELKKGALIGVIAGVLGVGSSAFAQTSLAASQSVNSDVFVQPAANLGRYEYYYFSRFYNNPSLTASQLASVDTLIMFYDDDPTSAAKVLANPVTKMKFEHELARVKEIRQANGFHFKIVLGLGDLDAINESNINTYIANLKVAMVQYGLSGIDIDWESKVSISQYSYVVNHLGQALRPQYTISASLGWFPEPVVNYYPKLRAVRNNIDAATFQYYVGATNALPAGLMVLAADGFSLFSGIPRSHIYVGIPIYGAKISGANGVSYSWLLHQGANCHKNYYKGYFYTGVDLAKQKIHALKKSGYGGYFNFEMSLDEPYSSTCSIVRAEDEANT